MTVPTTINGWRMTAAMGKRWTNVRTGRTVTLDEGLWSRALRRWMTPDEITELYLKVTGRPLWADNVGPEYRAAERKWQRYLDEEAGS